MALNPRKGLQDLMAGRNKGSLSKEALKSQLPFTLPPPPPLPTTTIGLLFIPNLKKKRKEQEVKEGEVVPQKEAKQQKTAKDKRALSVDSREDPSMAEVCQQQRTWAPRLELDGAAIPWNSSIREFQRGHSAYVAETLDQPLLLPKDMDALRHMRQPDLFMSLKRDLAMISSLSYLLAKC